MNKGYSQYLKPVSIFLDVLLLNILVYFFVIKHEGLRSIVGDIKFFIIINLGWLVISYMLGLYRVYRFTKVVRIIRDLGNQLVIFFLLISSIFAWAHLVINRELLFIFFGSMFLLMLMMKILLFFGLRNYRIYGGNYRNVIIVGYHENSQALHRFFINRPEYGYKFNGFFTDDDLDISKGKIKDVIKYVLDNKIDEIYCTIEYLTKEQMKELVDFADNNMIVLKFIPISKGIYTRGLSLQYYDYQAVFALRENPFDDSIQKVLKRFFDIVFSSLVIVFVLSWLVPILGFFIKKESKGSVFFKQKRSGLANKEFEVFKFRSMGVNKKSDSQQATKNDPRITKIGAFIRKTSIDELPQFINVFKGEMSVVGPRPHMLSHTEFYKNRIDKFMVRHIVKPGITGLAQVRGLRGETETVNEMRARSRMDRFYIEHWSMILDVKIIIQTFVNAIVGEEKAY
ncbi:MAG: exopolysaccharide biosynthesis polyprenyl glycosylphosphotransferase [Ichthyobacteriaceae bacterium]|nr:exopolysaccharide biosynthesis polyprenyl glycosylphosphotransferase [Ichthyobacteriaceae bacterium]